MLEVFMVAKWLLVFAALAVVGAPLAAVAFPQLPRRGAAFAIPVALIPITVLAFWLGQVAFGLPTVFASLLAVFALSALALRRGVDPDWRAVAAGYVVFAVGFCVLVTFRAYGTGVTPYGGEQFFHFGLVKSLLRADALPPEDFWFAGEPVRYYFGGQLQVAMMAMLTNTEARYAFNLGAAAFYGMLFATAYGLVGTVSTLRGRSHRLGGAVGVFFVAVAGTLVTTVRLVFGLLPLDTAVEYGRPAFGYIARRFYLGRDGVETVDAALRAAIGEQAHLDSWSWWYTRYVVPGTLHEFPFYSFIKGDIPGQALTNAYILLAAALALAYYLTPETRRRRRLATLFGGMGLVAGVFGFMHTWALPCVVGLAWLSLAAADQHPATLLPDPLAGRLRFGVDVADDAAGDDPADTDDDEAPVADAPDSPLVRRLAAEGWRVVLAGVLAVGVGLVGVAVASPFLVFGEMPNNGGVGFLPPRTDLGSFLVLYAGIFALFVAFVCYRAWPTLRERSPRTVAGGAVAVLAVAVALVLVVDFAVLAVTGPLLLGTWWLVRTDRAGFEGVLVAAGVGLLLSMEVVHARVAPYDLPRWNTSLKVAVQAWTLGAAGAGVITTVALGEAYDALDARFGAAEASAADGPGEPSSSTDVADDRPGSHAATTAADGSGGSRSLAGPLAVAGLAVCVVLASTPFVALAFSDEVLNPAFADDEDGNPLTVPRFHEDRPTLDGLARHEQWKEDQMAAIDWLDERRGRPVIVEPVDSYVPDDPDRIYVEYSWITPASTLTGLPTVLGWDHQVNYRGADAYRHRMRQVNTVYTGSWENATAVLREYDVRYVYVGPRAHEEYGDDLRNFRVHEGVSVAFQNPVVTIYAVDQSELAADDGRDDGTGGDDGGRLAARATPTTNATG